MWKKYLTAWRRKEPEQMINQTAFRADFKLISREPILILFMILPLFIMLITRLFISFGVPLLFSYLNFDLAPYFGYILIMALLMAPFMLGTVCGFLMIDDRDARMFELMSITPMGYLGYIVMRSLIPFSAAVIYTFVGYFIIDIFYLAPALLILIAMLNALSGVTVGLLLFNYAGDKVKAVAFSKGLGLLNVLALADLFNLPWLSLFAALTPFYWVVRLATVAATPFTVAMAILVHLFWLFFMLHLLRRPG
jgi:fluoroquinolone transport system permease protein